MKNTVIFAITVLLLPLALSSCVTGSGKGAWKSYPAVPAYWNYQTGEIKVTVDHVPEDHIASQLRVIAETLLARGKKSKIETNFSAPIDIQMEQRSFLYGTKLYNAIYIACFIRDEEGNVLGSEYEYITTEKRNIISPKEQYRLLKPILGRIIKDQRKRYWETRRYMRKNKLTSARGNP